MEANASGIMCWLVFSNTLRSSAYLLEPVTTILQNRKGDIS
jgi:hypothetical protein